MSVKLLKATIAMKRGLQCEACGDYTMNLQLHHWLFHRMKGVPELDSEENCGLVCHKCHGDVVNGYESRRSFWKRQVERGYDMDAWLDGLPLKFKQRFD